MHELTKIAEEKQRFIDNFAHEIRTPLTTIYGYAEYIQKANITDEEKVLATTYIMSESQRMEILADQLLELATMRNLTLLKEIFPVEVLFTKVEQTLSQKAQARNITLKFSHNSNQIYGDKNLLECLLLNLVHNGIKACNKYDFLSNNLYNIDNSIYKVIQTKENHNSKVNKNSHLISVSIQSQDNGVILTITDTGKGMTSEQLTHITEPFYLVDKSRNRKDGGTGLGLSICKQIASAHDSELVFSSTLHKGTTVSIFLQLPPNLETI